MLPPALVVVTGCQGWTEPALDVGRIDRFLCPDATGNHTGALEASYSLAWVGLTLHKLLAQVFAFCPSLDAPHLRDSIAVEL